MARKYRISVAGSRNSRISTNNILNTISGVVGAGVIGTMIIGKTGGGTAKDQRFINCHAETVSDAATGEKKVYTVKRPGFAVGFTPAASIGTAILVWTGYGTGTKVISAFGATNSTIYDSTTSLGAITGRATGIAETTVSGTPTLLVSSTDNTGWYYDVGIGVMTKITDADFPGNASLSLAGTFANMNGYAFIMDTTGKLWASDLNSVTAWTATSFDSSNLYPDKGVGCVRHRNFIMTFGTESIEFFYNAGLTPFPLTKNVGLTQNVGCISADAIAQIADTTFWCGSSPQGGLSIFQYDESLSRLSTPEVDSILILAGSANISLTTIRFHGRSFVIVKASTETLVYCIEEKQWSEWSSSAPVWYKCVGISIGNTMTNYSVSNTLTSGVVYSQSPSTQTFQDAGSSYVALMQLDSTDFGTSSRKFFSELTVIADIESTASPLELSYSDDDYVTTTLWGNLDLSENMPKARQLGSSKRRAWILNHSANTPMRIQAIEGLVEIGN